MASKAQFNVEIDKLTRSIENAITGDSFRTEILPVTDKDFRRMKKADWLFDWKKEAKHENRKIYKLVILDNPDIIQGLVSIENRHGHIYMHLIESNHFNRGNRKVYVGVPGNLIAFICKLSFENGNDGFVSFESKTKLIDHYQNALGARVLYGNVMSIETLAAERLVAQYFPSAL